MSTFVLSLGGGGHPSCWGAEGSRYSSRLGSGRSGETMILKQSLGFQGRVCGASSWVFAPFDLSLHTSTTEKFPLRGPGVEMPASAHAEPGSLEASLSWVSSLTFWAGDNQAGLWGCWEEGARELIFLKALCNDESVLSVGSPQQSWTSWLVLGMLKTEDRPLGAEVSGKAGWV